MASKNPNTVTVNDIEVTLDPVLLNDWDFAEAVAETSDETLPIEVRNAAVFRVARMAFGPDYGRIKGELREKNDGRLPNETMGQFLTDVLLEYKAKNS